MGNQVEITENMTLGEIVLLPELEAYKNAIKYDGEELEASMNEDTGDREFFTALKDNVQGGLALKGTNFLLDMVHMD